MNTSRRDFLKLTSTSAIGVQFFGLISSTAQAATLPAATNLMLIMTDQERPPMWFPAGWEAANLPNTMRLKNKGLSFERAFCSTAMCTPSRNTLFTGLFPAQHRAKATLTEDFAQTPFEPQLDPALPNMATCLKEAGYDVIYKGKWHMSHGVEGADERLVEDDISRYGFDGWDAPDAGGDTAMKNFGGGTADHDQRFVEDAIAFLENRIQKPTGRPFCLIVSLVNPHDVLAYPGVAQGQTDPPSYLAGGYDATWLQPTTPAIGLPPTIGEDLAANLKPTAHARIKAVMALGLGPLVTPAVQQEYLNFYGNLMKKIDGQIGQLLSTFDSLGAAGTTALNQTLTIRTSDHGENGLCHGGLRQKTFVTYDEVLRVPLIFSNPVLYPVARTTEALVSHVDLLPTLCALTNVPNWQAKGFQGIDYSSVVVDPLNAAPVQEHVLFTFDDIYAASNAANFPDGVASPPNRIQMIRSSEHKYARYFDGAGVEPDQEEFYDLRPAGGDYDASYQLPLEMRNLSTWAETRRVVLGQPTLAEPAQTAAREALKLSLQAAVATRLAPAAPLAAQAPEDMTVEIRRWIDDRETPHARVEIFFISRLGTSYQLQRSTTLDSWIDVGDAVAGNNGPIILTDEIVGGKAFYRLSWKAAT